MGKINSKFIFICKLIALQVFMCFFLLFTTLEASDLTNVKNLTFCGEQVPIGQTSVYESIDQNLILLSEARSRIWLAIKRSGRFLPMIEKQLANFSIPNDIKYVPMVLTGLDPFYKNNGYGIWKLKEGEAIAMGLTINSMVDERLDPVASTTAVLNKISNLNDYYRNWQLAIAAFINGESVINDALAISNGGKNFYSLYLPNSVDNSMSQIIAGKIIFSDPYKFNYQVDKNNLWSPMSGKRIQLDKNYSLKELAGIYKVDYKRFRDLNPHLISDTAPQGAWINLP